MTKSILALVLAGAAGCMLPGPYQTSPGPYQTSPGQNPNYGGGSYGGGGAPASSAPASSEPMPAATPAAATTAPAGPQVVSVELHNDCSNTVKLFLGQKPKYGSGTSTSLGSNTTTSYQMKPGDMIWIIDDSENGLSSTTIGGGNGSQRIRITSSCTGFGS